MSENLNSARSKRARSGREGKQHSTQRVGIFTILQAFSNLVEFALLAQAFSTFSFCPFFAFNPSLLRNFHVCWALLALCSNSFEQSSEHQPKILHPTASSTTGKKNTKKHTKGKNSAAAELGKWLIWGFLMSSWSWKWGGDTKSNYKWKQIFTSFFHIISSSHRATECSKRER